jgi:hypothetical protein
MNATCRSSPSRYTNFPSSLPGHPRPSLALIPYSERTTSLGSGQWKSRTANWFWFELADSLHLNFYLTEGGWSKIRSLARWSSGPSGSALARPPAGFKTRSCTPNPAPAPPARAWAGRHHPGVVGELAAGCIPSVPPVGSWGRLGASSWPQIRRWDRRRCCWRISGPPGGPEIRWILSVGWCPSKRVVVIQYARRYTVQNASGGCVTAISGSASKFAEDTCYECRRVGLVIGTDNTGHSISLLLANRIGNKRRCSFLEPKPTAPSAYQMWREFAKNKSDGVVYPKKWSERSRTTSTSK